MDARLGLTSARRAGAGGGAPQRTAGGIDGFWDPEVWQPDRDQVEVRMISRRRILERDNETLARQRCVRATRRVAARVREDCDLDGELARVAGVLHAGAYSVANLIDCIASATMGSAGA